MLTSFYYTEVLSSFTHPHVDFLFSVGHKRRNLEDFASSFFSCYYNKRGLEPSNFKKEKHNIEISVHMNFYEDENCAISFDTRDKK